MLSSVWISGPALADKASTIEVARVPSSNNLVLLDAGDDSRLRLLAGTSAPLLAELENGERGPADEADVVLLEGEGRDMVASWRRAEAARAQRLTSSNASLTRVSLLPEMVAFWVATSPRSRSCFSASACCSR